MPNKPLKLGDLVKPDRLKKPVEGAAKIELGAKPEKIKALEGETSDLAARVERDADVMAGAVTGLADAVKRALVKELSPEKEKELLKILRERFLRTDKHYSANENYIKAIKSIRWEDVQKKLEANPEKLWSLNEMERTGGEPDVFGYDAKTDKYIFMDFSKESPTGRCNCCYDLAGQREVKQRGEKTNGNAVEMAARMGIDLLSKTEYRELQTKGEFDKNSWSWLKTPVDKRKEGGALSGYRHRRNDVVYIFQLNPINHDDNDAFRASLRV